MSAPAKDVSMEDFQAGRDGGDIDRSSRNGSAQFIEHADASNGATGSISSSASSSINSITRTGSGTEPPRRSRSTLIFEDDISYGDDMAVDPPADNEQVQSPQRQPSQQPPQPVQPAQPAQPVQPVQPVQQPQPIQEKPVLVPTIFKWTEGGEKVFVMGTFTGWRKMIALNGPSPVDGSFKVQIALPPGTHRFKFVVDNEVRCSNFIPTATDSSGHFVNYLEIAPSEKDLKTNAGLGSKSGTSLYSQDSKLGLTKDDDDMGNGYTRYHEDAKDDGHKDKDYINTIPPIFTDPKVMEEYYVTLDNSQKSGSHNQQWLIPPQLPPHLENVILNNYNNADRENTGGALPIPNHVVLNHLATTSIKHNTLAVASTVRYKRKYVTQILYAPLQ